MRSKTVLILVSAVFLLLSAIAVKGIAGSKTTLDDLSSSKVGDFPKRWRTWPLQRGKAEQVYTVAEEGGQRFIHARDEADLSQQIFLNFNWPLEEKPNLSWRWRATELPAGAAESNDATNDSACGVYVVFGKYSGHAIKYVWSTTLPAGQVVTRHSGKLKIKVMDTGSKKGWSSHTVNVIEDYKALFNAEPDKVPSGIGILTDGNAVHKPAGCDYTGFAISSKE